MWANGDILKNCSLLFLLYLRDPKVQNVKSIKELVQLYSPEETIVATIATYLRKCKGENVVFLFDGFDELPVSLRQSSFIAQVIEREGANNKLYKSTIIVTSRPTCTATLLLYRKIDIRIEILGFAKEERDEYILRSLSDSANEIEELNKYLDKHPIINSLCFIPLHIAILLFLFKRKSLPETLTEMNEKFIIHTIYRYLNKKSPGQCVVVKQLKDLPRKKYSYIQKLSKLAFKGLEINQLVFSYDEIRKFFPENDDINGFGLLQVVDHYSQTGAGKTKSFNFLHFTMQEYFAAYYVSSFHDEKEQLSLMKETFWTGHYNFMWIMYMGINGLQSNFISFVSSSSINGNNDTGDSGRVAQYILRRDILKDKRKCLHLFLCYMEIKHEKCPPAVSSIFSGCRIELNGITLLAHHVSSLIYFMSSATQKWRMLNLESCNLRSIGMNSLLEHVLYMNKDHISSLEYVDLSGNNSSPWTVYCVIIRHCCVISLTLCGDDG